MNASTYCNRGFAAIDNKYCNATKGLGSERSLPFFFCSKIGQHSLPYFSGSARSRSVLNLKWNKEMTTLDRLRSEHHKAAKMLAAGFSVWEVSIQTNRTEKSIDDLISDPAFSGLVQFYRKQNDED